MSYYKINKNFTIEPTDNVDEAWKSKEDNQIGLRDVVNNRLVSTVFLVSDHQFGDGEPLLFETMVFDGEDIGSEIYLDRYSNYYDAKDGHELAKSWAMSELD